MDELNTDYEVRQATLVAMGGSADGLNTIFEVDKAILKAVQEGGGGLQPVVVEELPATGEAGKMYFVPNEDPSVQDNYKEYIWIDDAWECVGNANVDLSEVAKIVNLTQAEYDALEEYDEATIYNITDAPELITEDDLEDYAKDASVYHKVDSVTIDEDTYRTGQISLKETGNFYSVDATAYNLDIKFTENGIVKKMTSADAGSLTVRSNIDPQIFINDTSSNKTTTINADSITIDGKKVLVEGEGGTTLPANVSINAEHIRISDPNAEGNYFNAQADLGIITVSSNDFIATYASESCGMLKNDDNTVCEILSTLGSGEGDDYVPAHISIDDDTKEPYIMLNSATVISSEEIFKIKRLTQEEYDALEEKDDNTLYVIAEAITPE